MLVRLYVEARVSPPVRVTSTTEPRPPGQRRALPPGEARRTAPPTFNAVWQYACRHRLLKDGLDPAGATAIGRRFQLALAWLVIGALLGLLIPVLGVAVIAAFSVFHWLPIRGESPRPRS